MSTSNSSKTPEPVTPTTLTHVAEAWEAYRDSQPEDWELMMGQTFGEVYHRRRKL